MRISDLMKKPVRTVQRADTAAAAAKLLASAKIGCVPVCDGAQAVGMLTDRDLCAKVIAAGRDPAGTACGEVMSSPVAAIAEGDSLEAAVQAMDRAGVHHLVVNDAQGRMTGILALGDLAVHLMFSRAPAGPDPDDPDNMGEMTMGIPEPTLADEVIRLTARDAWR